jgi:hypothetical protein
MDTGYLVAHKRYWRKASVIMASVSLNAGQSETGHRFHASWERVRGGYQLSVFEWFPQPTPLSDSEMQDIRDRWTQAYA